jgi:hypothetical protein
MGTKKEIEFTQYLRPTGRPRKVWIERSEPIAQKAQAIQAMGYSFECEELVTGMVSLTISDGEQDVAIELCQNGPEVPATVDRLIEEFYGHRSSQPL